MRRACAIDRAAADSGIDTLEPRIFTGIGGHFRWIGLTSGSRAVLVGDVSGWCDGVGSAAFGLVTEGNWVAATVRKPPLTIIVIKL